MTTFSDLGLSAPILEALAREGYERPTPIQGQAIPPVLAGRDLLGIAQTGTGKTAAFALPMIQRLAADKKPAPRKGCRALILSPTRELASQIEESFRAYGRGSKLTSTVVFGGVPVPRQERIVANGVDILVATPGRLLDLIDRRSLSLSNVEILVLDEADQMLDLGFIHALRRIVTLLPKQRQTLFFSATMPTTIASLADGYLTDPVKVSVAPVATTAERVEQRVTFVSQPKKQPLLEHVLRSPDIERVLVFTRTKHGADKVVRGLEKAGIPAFAIHGNKSQGQRERALGAFKNGSCKVLVATDIAARGIDVEAVSHVVNFDLPNVPEQYVHRIGRTARAGASGIALSFCNEEERAYLRDIQKLTRLTVPVEPVPAGFDAGAVAPLADEPARAPRPAGAGRNNRRGGRGNGGGGAQRPAHAGHAPAAAKGEPARGGRPAARPAKPAAGDGSRKPASGAPAARGRGDRDGSSIAWLSGSGAGGPSGSRPRRGR
ncbi:DEAD/DEAH box helicase [Salinarimonas rosea]|uniref:DEAD/DEAH box helicase n=1 Tax=Salinarimonas rosea TaxID=552063 RepID=UPI000407E367|nr:DEAD/DEAH box helicase [Salinarimonas rosea]